MRSQGNTSAGGSTDRSRPLPRAEGRRSAHQVHASAKKSEGLDWGALSPACRTCGVRSGQVDTETGLCPTCADPAASTPIAPPEDTPETPPGEQSTGAGGEGGADVDDALAEIAEYVGRLVDAKIEADSDEDDLEPAPTWSAAPPATAAAGERQQLLEVLVDELHPDPDNPRQDLADLDDLAASIAAAGLLQPIVARRARAEHGDRLVVVAGHRRLAAVKQLGWTRVAVIVRRDMPSDEVLAAMLIENGQRAGLDPIEEARALHRLAHDHKLGTHKQIGALIGRSQPHVSDRIALLSLSVEDQDAVRAGELSVGAAVRRGRVAAGKVRPGVSTGHPHLGAEHPLARAAKARCVAEKHKRGGRNSVGGVACGACWESVIRADERTHLHDVSNERGRCVLCDTDRTPS